MTEIPEHLLKRAAERRAALGGESAPAATPAAPATPAASTGVEAAPASAAPATPAKAAAPAAPPPPKPDIPVVAAAKARKKIPMWAMAGLSILPLWAFMYVRSLTPSHEAASGPLGEGAVLYNGGCATCHNADGSGSAGRRLNNGEVLLTFPHIEDQLNLVYTGSQAYETNGVGFYGDPSRGHLTFNGAYMPGQGEKVGGTLSEAQILAVVCHERYDLGGADPDSPEYAAEFALWCAEDSEIFLGLEDGSLTFDTLAESVEGVLPVGTAPRPGTPAG